MSNLVKALLEQKRIENYLNNHTVIHRVIRSKDSTYENIKEQSKIRNNGISINSISEYKNKECVEIVMNGIKSININELYCFLGFHEMPLIIVIKVEALELMLNLSEFWSKSITLYSLDLDGCCVIDLPTPDRNDFGVVLYGKFEILSDYFKLLLHNS